MHINNSVLSLIQGSSNDSNSFDDSGSVSKSDSDTASDSALNWQTHSHPDALMGLEVKLEGQVCVAHWSAAVTHQFPTMTYWRGMSSQVRVALNVG